MKDKLDLNKCVKVPLEAMFLTGIEDIDNDPKFIELRQAIFTPSNKNYDKSVYLLEFQDGTIKIGVSKEPEKRIKTIINQSGRILKNKYITESISNSFTIESKIKNRYRKNRLNGEYFKLNYEDLKREIIEEVKSNE